jgi:hypothetical protein
MGTYYVNEAAFEIDESAFDDRTVHVLASRGAGDVSLLVTRSAYRAGESLREAVARHVERERRSFSGWRQLDVTEGRLEDAPVIVLATRWRGTNGLVFQRQAHIGLEATVLLLVASGPMSEREICDRHIERALGSFRARQEGP